MLDIAKKANRPGSSSGAVFNSQYEESKKDLATYLRSRGEIKTMVTGDGTQGGWTVHPALADGIGTLVRNTSAVRQLLSFTPIESGSDFEEIISITPALASWVGESQARPVTTNPSLVKITTALDDSSVGMVDWLTTERAISFSEAEETALFDGTGVNMPRGLNIIATAATADATRPFGTIQYIPTGASGDFSATDPFDCVKTLFYSLRAGYRTNAQWVCNSATVLELSLLKNDNDNYLWQPSIKAGDPPTLLGRPVVISEAAPAIATDSKSLWLADWNQAIRAIDWLGVA